MKEKGTMRKKEFSHAIVLEELESIVEIQILGTLYCVIKKEEKEKRWEMAKRIAEDLERYLTIRSNEASK